ncbi:MAG: HAD-IA family hydrolase [Patescibacteria group bacterium]|nr:HAD-IA family hydrolase [Patescibacteria group bacterium]
MSAKYLRPLKRGQIKLVTFDFGRTLAGIDHLALSRMISHYFERTVTPAQVLKAEQRHMLRESGFKMEPNAKVPIPQNAYEFYADIVTDCFGLAPEQLNGRFAEFAVQANRFHEQQNWYSMLLPGSVECLDMLQSKVPLGVISNANGNLERDLPRLGIRHYFDFVIDSGVEGVCKPNPEIFRRALAKADTPPDRAIHIGDDPKADAQGALDAGMHAIQYDSPGLFAKKKILGARYCRNLVSAAEHLLRFI